MKNQALPAQIQDVGRDRLRSIIGTKGGLLTSNGQGDVILLIGADGKVLTADSTSPNGVSWKAAGAPATTVVDERNLGLNPIVGVLPSYAREDHGHGNDAAGSQSTLQVGSGGTAGAGNFVARNTHIHNVPKGTPIDSYPEDGSHAGASGNFADAEHVHKRERFMASGWTYLSSDYTYGGNTYADIPFVATPLTIAFESDSAARGVEVGISGTVTIKTNDNIDVTLVIDGSYVQSWRMGASSAHTFEVVPITLSWRTGNFAAGNHTFKFQSKYVSGSYGAGAEHVFSGGSLADGSAKTIMFVRETDHSGYTYTP